MNDMDKEQRIRKRAHEIWERDGRPEGQHDEHWDQARREIEDEDAGASSLERTVTDTIGLAVGADEAPGEARHPSEPAEGDRDTVDRELSRQKKATKTKAPSRSKKS